MSTATNTSALFTAALNLPKEKREELVRELIISLDADVEKDPDYDRLWAEEIEARCAAFDRGEAEAWPLDEAMKRIRESLRSGRPL